MTEKIKHWYTNGLDEIQAFDCPDGYVPGRLKASEETKRKHRENNGMHKLTEEQKMERALKIKQSRSNWTEEQKEAFSLKMSSVRKGKGVGKEPWNKGKKSDIPAWNKGLKQSEEVKQHLRDQFSNLSDEEKQRRAQLISQANTGRIPWNKGKHYKLPKDTILKAKLKEYNTRKKNHSFTCSKIEEYTYNYLSNLFGADNIIRQYRDTLRYPFNCDFYIPLMDLFIEVNINWTHGGMPYEENDLCLNILNEWKEKAKESDYYKNAIYTWTDLDVRKRKISSKNKLNYKSLYSEDEVYKFLEDLSYRVKFINQLQDLGFPTYYCSDLDLMKQYKSLSNCECDVLSNNKHYCNRLINYMHPSSFKANRYDKVSPYNAYNNMILLNKVIDNRIKYIGEDLTSEDIVRGFSVSGIAPKVSIFNPYLAKYIVKKYLNDFNSIFDPCSGYSGRLLGTCSLGKTYIGQDINPITIEESKSIVSKLNLNAHLECKDLTNDSGEYECLFTCPPYGNKENWNQDVLNKSCDEWIDIILRNYKCERYVFVVDSTEKYKNYIVETISNKSHLNSSKEYIVVIDIV